MIWKLLHFEYRDNKLSSSDGARTRMRVCIQGMIAGMNYTIDGKEFEPVSHLDQSFHLNPLLTCSCTL
jgi:hypothetical protein